MSPPPSRTTLRRLLAATARACTLAAAHLALAFTITATAGDFTSSVSAARKDHYKFAPIAAQTLIMADKLDEGLQVFVTAVPEAQLTAADCTVLAELFFRIDAAESLHYYRRAHDLLPDEPETSLALAKSLHRTGQYTEASHHYQHYLATDPDRFLPNALQAECLIRARKAPEALAHWQKASPEDNSLGIGRSIFEIHGPASPLRRRADLLAALQQGQTEKLEELIALSAQWDQDWWSTIVNKPFLRRDLDLAKKLLTRDPRRLAELTLYASTYLEDPTPESLKKDLEAHHWIIGENATLPASARVAERLISLAVKHHLADVPTLLAQFEKDLRQRSLGPGTNDLGAVNLLAGLMLNAGKARAADLTAVKHAGWQQYRDPGLAGAYLADQLNQNKLTPQNFELRRALTEFPQDALLCMLDVIVAKEERKPLRAPLLAAIPAEFTQLSPSVGTIRDITRLNAFFSMLKEDLASQEVK